MDVFLDYPLTTLFVIVVLVWVVTKVGRKTGILQMRSAVMTCPHCGTKLPAVARFCRMCGQEVQK